MISGLCTGQGAPTKKTDLLSRQENYVTEKRKEYKKLRPLLLPVKKWVGLLRGRMSDSNTTPKKTTHEKASKA